MRWGRYRADPRGDPPHFVRGSPRGCPPLPSDSLGGTLIAVSTRAHRQRFARWWAPPTAHRFLPRGFERKQPFPLTGSGGRSGQR